MTNLLTPLCCTSVIFSAESKWDEMEKKNTKSMLRYKTILCICIYMSVTLQILKPSNFP